MTLGSCKQTLQAMGGVNRHVFCAILNGHHPTESLFDAAGARVWRYKLSAVLLHRKTEKWRTEDLKWKKEIRSRLPFSVFHSPFSAINCTTFAQKLIFYDIVK